MHEVKKVFRPDEHNLHKTFRQTYILTIDPPSKSEQQQSKQEIEKPDPKIIYAINFGEDAMIIVAKTGLTVYSLISLKIVYTRYGFFWDAMFIPDTSCLAIVEHDGTRKSRRTLKILDLATDTIIASVVIAFEIEHLRISKHCIGLGGIKEVAVIHFPTLKPICHEMAGTGINNVFDLSYEGLTLAYQCQTRGMLIVHHFTQLISSLKRKQTVSKVSQSPYSGSKKKKDKIREIVEIKAHKENICLIKFSPNGARVATASNKGTMIRIFLTATGTLWQELRVGYDLCKILDMNFYEEGNILACLSEKNIVQVFNVKLEAKQLSLQNQRRGYVIYQQSNPKSMFSFLSFFYSNFGNELPFAFKQLVKPKEKAEEEKVEEDKKNVESYMPVVLQEEEAHHDEEGENEKEEASENQKEPEMQKKTDSLIGKIKKSGSQIPLDSRRSSSFSIKMHKKNSLLQFKKDEMSFVPTVYNTEHKIFIGGNNFIWVAKGSYLFILKYDPFNGGEMYHKDTILLR